jgi:hypothetical protein
MHHLVKSRKENGVNLIEFDVLSGPIFLLHMVMMRDYDK